uniref:Uncharacterized protein n=1 Tax=Lynx canadensis TaxID=61383 RepID=A0A667H162_LYNCA
MSLGGSTTAEDIKTQIKNYQTAPFDSHFPNQNQTRNRWQNCLSFHHCEKTMTARGDDVSMCKIVLGVCTQSIPYPGGDHPGMMAWH